MIILTQDMGLIHHLAMSVHRETQKAAEAAAQEITAIRGREGRPAILMMLQELEEEASEQACDSTGDRLVCLG